MTICASMHCPVAGDSAIWTCVLHFTEQGSEKMLLLLASGQQMEGGASSPIDPAHNLPFPVVFIA